MLKDPFRSAAIERAGRVGPAIYVNSILTLPAHPFDMVLPRVAQAQSPMERRAAGRAHTDCPARLQTPGGDWHGRLWDLSEEGARVQVSNPPAQGVMCLISWQANELFCRIVWTADDMCGVLFERPISRAVVQQTLGEPEPEIPSGPAASVGNIPIGRRRGHLRLTDS
jgi:hypothetical protein